MCKCKKKPVASGRGWCFLFVIIIVLLFGWGIWNMSIPNNIDLHKSCVYIDSLAGPIVEITEKHHETNEPWRVYFGTKASQNEVIDSFHRQEIVSSITDLSNTEDKANRYLLKIHSELGAIYQELYALKTPFPKHKKEQGYVLRDSIISVYQNEDEIDVLFPCSILDYDAESLLDEADELWVNHNSWNYHDAFLDKDENIVEFLLKFYNDTNLYHATEEDGKVYVTFDRDVLNGMSLTNHQETILEKMVFDGMVVMDVDADEKTLNVVLEDESWR